MQFSSRLPVAVHILLAIVEFEGKEKTTSTLLYWMSLTPLRKRKCYFISTKILTLNVLSVKMFMLYWIAGSFQYRKQCRNRWGLLPYRT